MLPIFRNLEPFLGFWGRLFINSSNAGGEPRTPQQKIKNIKSL
jgi:hypothetical protein